MNLLFVAMYRFIPVMILSVECRTLTDKFNIITIFIKSIAYSEGIYSLTTLPHCVI